MHPTQILGCWLRPLACLVPLLLAGCPCVTAAPPSGEATGQCTSAQAIQGGQPVTCTPSDKMAKGGAPRHAARLVPPTPTTEGAGVRLTRAIGTSRVSNKDLDPFLMLDHFHSDDPSDYVAGFPDHPHRGFETVTYMLAGSFEHKDKCGNRGLLKPGSIQWMTAGKGIIHSEMPKQVEGLVSGFQLWVNLPAKDKMCEPRYQDVQPEEIPVVPIDDAGSDVKVCCGTYNGVTGPVQGGYIQPEYLDVRLQPSAEFRHAVPGDHTAFAYVYSGVGSLGGKDVKAPMLVIFENSGGDTIEAKSQPTADPNSKIGGDKTYGLRFILVSAKAIGEPVAQMGPFVMNTQAELDQARVDFQEGRLGRY